MLKEYVFNWIKFYFKDYINLNNYNLNGAINTRANIGTRKIFIMKRFTKKIKIIFSNINEIFMIKILLLIIK